jgi:uncharacterized protein (TIRG00374 family)
MRRLAGLSVGIAIMAVLWWRIDLRAIFAAMRDCDPLWLVLGLAAVVPLTLATAWRFAMLVRPAIGLAAATRLILSSSTLNLILPSKMGDLAKAWVLTRRYGFDGGFALAVVVIEKLLDLASLLIWGVAALLWIGALREPLMGLALALTAALLALLLIILAPSPNTARLIAALAQWLPPSIGKRLGRFGAQWGEAVAWFWQDWARASQLVVLSLTIWAGHLGQFWLFARAIGGDVPFVDNMAFATLAILVGLLPFTIAGIGTRDAAIVLLYGAWLRPGQAAVLGVLATCRYLIPALAGLPFIRDYWAERARADAAT